VATARALFKEFKKDDVPGLAAEVAYHAIFAIPALILVVVLIAALVEQATTVDVVERLRTAVNDSAPQDTHDILNSLIDNAIANVSGGLASLGLIAAAAIAIWSGSNAVATMMKAFNRAYGIEEDRGFVRKKAVAIGLTLLLGGLINLAFLLLVFGQSIGTWLAERLGFGSAFETFFAIARWPLGVLLIMIVLAVLYYLGPNIEHSFRWISPGSILATVIWVLATIAFSIYMQVSDPGSAYGSLGSLLVFLLFLYITGIVLLVGAEFNAILERRYDPEARADIAQKQQEGEALEAFET
jgi:membrane protein